MYQTCENIGLYRNGLTYSPSNITDENNGTLVLRSSNIKDSKLSLNDNLYVDTFINNELKIKKMIFLFVQEMEVKN